MNDYADPMRDGEVEPGGDRRSVFVVHGRNEALRKSMFDFLRSINLAPMEWSRAIELAGEASPYIGQVLDSAFDHASAVVVLMTPDEVAYLQPAHASGEDDPETAPAEQARPNVLFEAGMALGRDPKRTVLVEVGKVRPFSDVAGRHAVRLSNDLAKRQDLAQRLANAGCDVDTSGTDWHSTGDFSPPDAPGDGFPLGRRVPSSASRRPPVQFDAQFRKSGGNRFDKLQIINRGSETVYDVSVEIPDDAALSLLERGEVPIRKIPGNGKSVTVSVLGARYLGDRAKMESFDIALSGRTESGEAIRQEVFIDMNG